ncbi:MAG: 9-O-acetylesterase [Lentisphaeria bacterium]|nr:9-O-acetylesterase [Lentisphaeria bacterium]
MMKSRWMRMLPAAALMLGGLAAEAKVELAPVFSDNAVLQRDMEVPVWGWADPGESVTVKFAGQTQTATAGKDGKWMVRLSPLAASKENRTLEVSGPENTVSAKDILVGEVWIASGQSNMEMPLWGGNQNFRHRNSTATGKEVADKTNLPLLRFTRMPRLWSVAPSPREPVKWNVAVPGKELEAASAAAFFFGRELQKELDVPVGILGAYWGGTRIEPWTPPEGFDSVPEVANIAKNVNAKLPGTREYETVSAKVATDYAAWLEKYKSAVAKGEQPPVPPAFPAEQQPFGNHQQPTVLYNKMLYGFVPYAVRGAIWYQGESNLGDLMLYKHKMQALLNGWRKVFNNPGMPFYFAQLAPYTYGGDPTRLPQLWEAQQAFVDANEKTGMAVITDAVHNIRDIHPADKEIVGKRLAYLALNRDYGRSDVKADSPRLKDSKIDGNRFVLDFNFVESWKNADGNSVPYFEVAGMDGVFYPAKATIDGTRITVSSDKVAAPKSLRYMWNQTNQGKLANEAGLVLGSFRIMNEPTFDELLAYCQKNGKLVYEYDLKSGSGFGDKSQVRYTVDNSGEIKGKITRITYLARLEDKNGNSQFVCVSMDPFTTNVKQTGVPVKSTGAVFQTRIRNLNVLSNVVGLQTGKIAEGNIEFWPNNYSQGNNAKIPNADDKIFDFGDRIEGPQIGYGSMQIHNFGAKQTIFAYNKFAAGAASDIGIGNQPSGNPDWTFSSSGNKLAKATLYVFVDETPRKSESELMDQVKARVPEAGSMKLAYAYDLRTGTGFGDRTRVNYELDSSAALTGKAKKVAYLMVLTGKDNKESWVYAAMDAFDQNVAKLGVPVKASGAVFQKKIANLEVKSNSDKVKTGTFAEGNIEFWSSNYGAPNAAGIPGASDKTFDFGDERVSQDPGYGSMQIHNFGEKQTVFAYNNFSAGANADAGIGNQPQNNPDWTFSGALKNYRDAWLYVLVDME